MGFPMTVERVIARNRLDEPDAMGVVNASLLDDIRRLAEDSATLAVRAIEAAHPERLRAAIVAIPDGSAGPYDVAFRQGQRYMREAVLTLLSATPTPEAPE